MHRAVEMMEVLIDCKCTGELRLRLLRCSSSDADGLHLLYCLDVILEHLFATGHAIFECSCLIRAGPHPFKFNFNRL